MAGELAEAREISRQYETTIREMCAEIEKRAPQFAQQKKLFEQSYDENVHLVRFTNNSSVGADRKSSSSGSPPGGLSSRGSLLSSQS